MDVKPLGKRLLVRKCFNPDIKDDAGKTLIILPDKSRDLTVFVEILAIGPKCETFSERNIGDTVRVVRNLSNHLNRIPGTDYDYLADEKIVEPCVYG